MTVVEPSESHYSWRSKFGFRKIGRAKSGFIRESDSPFPMADLQQCDPARDMLCNRSEGKRPQTCSAKTTLAAGATARRCQIHIYLAPYTLTLSPTQKSSPETYIFCPQLRKDYISTVSSAYTFFNIYCNSLVSPHRLSRKWTGGNQGAKYLAIATSIQYLISTAWVNASLEDRDRIMLSPELLEFGAPRKASSLTQTLQ